MLLHQRAWVEAQALLLGILGGAGDGSSPWALPPAEETQIGFQAPGFVLVQPQLLGVLGWRQVLTSR